MDQRQCLALRTCLCGGYGMITTVKSIGITVKVPNNGTPDQKSEWPGLGDQGSGFKVQGSGSGFRVQG